MHFRVWAPSRREVRVLIAGAEHPLDREEDGHHSGFVSGAADGALYQYTLDRDPTPYPDPASRFQPDGPHGPSMVVDPARYRWKHDRLDGPKRKGLVIQEIHVGTFTPEGTYRGAIEKLPLLRDVGINVIEIMPLAE
ncbi:MAG TPA: malto-oligosyltrehalose trehalohydrolase, partial [Thermoanaerobaculia bacterium]|nr:malto-oligosyltrehalose trehalohydrolase [Thermoanaerobaculia bacterium]